jgi:hypothetical protein
MVVEVVGPDEPSILPMGEERLGFLIDHGVIWFELDETRLRLQQQRVRDEILALCQWRKRLKALEESSTYYGAEGELEVVL